MARLRTWQGAIFALGMACAFTPAAADMPDPGTASMAPVVSGAETVDPAYYQTPAAFRWRITKTAWTESDERAFGEFVKAIGESRCRTFDECIKGPHNIYRASDPKGMFFFADCADLPYALRAYFAWKNGLPFSYASGVAAVGHSNDLRYSRYGNYVYARTDVLPRQEGGFPNGRSVLNALNNTISSAMFRFAPGETQGRLFDFYPVEISREAIRPGTVIYDPNGHVAVVYKVEDDGRILFIDAHPDNSLTRGSYGKRFVRASAPMGAGFKNWRPSKLVDATQGADGTWYGGRIVLAQDNELEGWSDEQFFGTERPRAKQWMGARFVYKGEALDYYDYVRQAMAKGDVAYDPIKETRLMVRELCDDLHYRAQSIDIAVKAGLNSRVQPARLPDNIYGTSGDWETYSTPSRDARLKTSFVELRDRTLQFLEMAKAHDPKLAYEGEDLPRDLKEAYRQEAEACEVIYTASNGEARRLSFEEARTRLFDFSFDPYHCPELRWGARTKEELATCPDGQTKRAWYDAQQRLRNQTERTYDVRMGFSLADLRASVPGSGRDAPPETDVLGAIGLETQPEQAAPEASDDPAAGLRASTAP